MRRCLSDGCRLRSRVSDRGVACGARPVLAVMPGWGAPRVLLSAFMAVDGFVAIDCIDGMVAFLLWG